MKVVRTSHLTAITRSREIPVTREELKEWKRSRTPIQLFFPNLSPDDREFLISGITPDEWDLAFKEGDDA